MLGIGVGGQAYMCQLSLFFKCVTIMKMKRISRKRVCQSDTPIHWLPIDSRLVSPLFSFSHVKGFSRFFLEVEITIAIVVVLGTLVILGLKVFSGM